MYKNLVIGIGGTGLSAIHEIRRLIAERFEKGLEDRAVASVRFIYIDTTEKDINSGYQWTVLGKKIDINDKEKVIVTGKGLDDVVRKPEEHDWARDWLPNLGDHYIGTAAEGAKGIRPYGRMIYEYGPNKEEIKKKITDACNDLNDRFGEVQEWRFYLVCGLSGGTGSGMFLPLSRDLSAEKGGVYSRGPYHKFRAFLILPPIAITGRHDRYHANAYAALSELNLHAFPPEEPPYDNCYLLEPQNAEGNNIGLKNLPVLIAQRIFLNIQQGTAADKMESLMDNPQLGVSERGRHACCFSSFGLSVVSYPREVVAQCLAYKLAATVVRSWLSTSNNAPGNVNEIVQASLDGVLLSENYILADSDPFHKKDYVPFRRQIRDAVNQKIQSITKKQLGDNALQSQQAIENDFRGKVGIEEFYQKRLEDVDGHRDVALKAVRQKVSSFLGDAEYGLDFARKFLDTLVHVLEELKQKTSEGASSKQKERTENFQNNLTKTITAIQTNEKALFYTGSRFHRDRTNLRQGLTSYLLELAYYNASRYGDRLLDITIPQIKNLRAELDVWATRADEAAGKLEGTLDERLTELSRGRKENGKVIFDKKSLTTLAEGASLKTIRDGIEACVLKLVDQDSLDLIQFVNRDNLQDVSGVRDDVYHAAYDWIVRSNCPINLFQDSFYDKFTDKYPHSGDRQDILTQTRDLSAPFVDFSGDEVGRASVVPDRKKAVTKPVKTGGMLADGRSAKRAVSEDLLASGTSEDETYEGNDPERIVFLQEVQAFPLRFIESLHYLKLCYDKYPKIDVLHADCRDIAKLPDLYLLTKAQEVELENANRAFVLGRALGWLKEDTNLHTRKQEISYEWDGELGPERLALGDEWEEAMQRFLKSATSDHNQSPDMRRAFELLAVRTRSYLEDCQRDESKKKEFLDASRDYLAARSKEYREKHYDPRYERDKKVLDGIRQAIG